MNKMNTKVAECYNDLETLRKDLRSSESYQCFSTHLINFQEIGKKDFSSRRHVRIMFVGRTTNGWVEDESRNGYYLTERDLDFLQNTHYMNNSQFWKVISQTVGMRDFAYSNLYRFAARESGRARYRPIFEKNINVNEKKYPQVCAELLYREISDLRVEKCIFLTGTKRRNGGCLDSNWINPFKKWWRDNDPAPLFNEHIDESRCHSYFNLKREDGNTVQCMEVFHPQGKKLQDLVEIIAKFLK